MTTTVPQSMCVISIGTNSPDRDVRMSEALRWLRRTFSPVIISDVYSTPEWSGRFPRYLNAVALVGVAGYVAMDTVNASLKLYERMCGRVPSDKQSGIVPVDLGIVVWRGDICRPEEFGRPYFTKGYEQVMGILSERH